jgi:hypothetical protein
MALQMGDIVLHGQRAHSPSLGSDGGPGRRETEVSGAGDPVDVDAGWDQQVLGLRA